MFFLPLELFTLVIYVNIRQINEDKIKLCHIYFLFVCFWSIKIDKETKDVDKSKIPFRLRMPEHNYKIPMQIKKFIREKRKSRIIFRQRIKSSKKLGRIETLNNQLNAN